MADLRLQHDVAARGEAALVGVLSRLGPEFVVIPHLTLPNVRWRQATDELDAVVLGPGGALLLEYLHWHGTVEMAAESAPWRLTYPVDPGIEAPGEDRASPLPRLRAKEEALEAYLAERGIQVPDLVTAVAFPDRTAWRGRAPVPVCALGDLAQVLEERLAAPGAPRDWLLAAADQLRPSSPPRTIQQYQLVARLSRSADRTSYLASDGPGGRQVLLTEIPYDPYASPDQLERHRKGVLRETKLAMGLSHPHIVRIERVIPRDDAYYVVSEWVEAAQPLSEVMGQGRLPVEVALQVGLSLASALDYAHGQGVVHRDLRPENVLVAPSTVKLTGFAMAKKADLGTRSTFDLRQMASESPYVAPEFKLGQEGPHHVDARADLYALGAILYRMLTGEVAGHLDERYLIPPSRLNPLVPPILDEVVAGALKFDPAQRYSTAAALEARLEDVLSPPPLDPDAPRHRYGDRVLAKRTRNSLIYSATDRKLDRQVALKKLLVDPAIQDRTARERQLALLLREAKLASNLVHPHVVAVFDHFIEDDDAYLVMEWLEGADLRDHLEGRAPALTVGQALEVVRQVGEALHSAHGHGIVHRDVKPENVIISQGHAMVLDFGIAHGGDPVPGGEMAKTAGTARYIAPEVLAGADGDARADVFSLGVVAYELLTGRYPYGPNVILGRYAPALVSPPPPMSALNMEVFPELDPVIARALAVDPADRPADMGAFLTALARALGGGLPGPGRASGGLSPERTRLRQVTIVAGVALALVLGALAGRHRLGRWFGLEHAPVVPLTSDEASATGSAGGDAAVPPRIVLPSRAPVAAAGGPGPNPLSHASTATGVTWEGAVEPLGPGLTARFEHVLVRGDGATVRFWVANRGSLPVQAIADRPGSVRLVDDLGRDYTPYLAVAPGGFTVPAGASSSLEVQVRTRLDEKASLLTLVLTGADGEHALKGFQIAP